MVTLLVSLAGLAACSTETEPANGTDVFCAVVEDSLNGLSAANPRGVAVAVGRVANAATDLPDAEAAARIGQEADRVIGDIETMLTGTSASAGFQTIDIVGVINPICGTDIPWVATQP